MTYEQSYYLLKMGVVGGGITIFIGLSLIMMGFIMGAILDVVGLFVMLGAVVQAFVFYKCPDCGEHFHIRGARKPDYCPKCGKKLD